MYKLVKNKSTGFFDVIEIGTEQVVFSDKEHGPAYEHYRFLKSGGSFAGWTPPFIILTRITPEILAAALAQITDDNIGNGNQGHKTTRGKRVSAST